MATIHFDEYIFNKLHKRPPVFYSMLLYMSTSSYLNIASYTVSEAVPQSEYIINTIAITSEQS